MKWFALLLLGAGWAAGCASAQGLTLSPVMIHAPAEGGATSLTLTSGLAEPKLVQVRVFDWTQAGGGEQMVPATDVRFGPEIFEILPGKAQTVRFLLPDTDGAGTWRVVVDELPAPPGQAAEDAAQLQLRLRYVLSMFAGEPGAPEQLQAAADAAGVELRNPGPGWLKMHSLALVEPDGTVQAAETGIVYLLPGAVARIPAGEDPEGYAALSYTIGPQSYSADLRRRP
ncbi:MAG: fimbria/pilus periplasmic chaperone [Hyphomonas sp.]